MAKKRDRRVQRTRQLLREALMALILEKGYDAVTVQEITDRANLGRATFYLHYKDKDELLFTSLEEVLDDLVEQMQPFSGGKWRISSAGPIAVAFRHAAESAQLYRVILNTQGGTNIPERIRSYVATYARQLIESHLKETGFVPMVPVDVLANHLAGSLIALLSWWLENDMPYPPEEMVGMYRRLVVLGAARVIGIDPAQLSVGDQG
jgi:AcrR family transcriptional regulator